LLKGNSWLTTLEGSWGLWTMEWFHWNCYHVDPWREKLKKKIETINHWCAKHASYVFVFLLEIKKLYYVCAIDDILIKQLETAEINVNVNPNICPCIYQLNAKSHVTCILNKLLWSRTKLFDNWRFSYKICKVAKLLISSGMGPVSPGLRVKLLQNISWPTNLSKGSFDGTNI
jgi:hypothetical protein